MNEEKIEVLRNCAREYFEAGKDEMGKGRYNPALVLFFKALVSCIDLFILRELGITPSSHGERFRIANENFHDVYEVIDKDFPFYQDSYTQMISKEIVEVIKTDAEIMAKKAGIEL